ncbi:MAG: hypothetical protein NTW36_03315 [Planctomycetia bacterium]|nr:hypothetical protein [Planctomycetia bacterium]
MRTAAARLKRSQPLPAPGQQLFCLSDFLVGVEKLVLDCQPDGPRKHQHIGLVGIRCIRDGCDIAGQRGGAIEEPPADGRIEFDPRRRDRPDAAGEVITGAIGKAVGRKDGADENDGCMKGVCAHGCLRPH